MGRPRVVRTPSEEREFQLRRKEARRARLRNQTEEQLAIARARNAAAQRRRRESNAEVRRLEAAKRRARREDAAVRQREAEMRRQRRQDAEVRLLEAAKHRARREDAAVRQREAEMRRRRSQDAEVRRLEAARRRARREDAAVRLREAEARRRRRLNSQKREDETEADWQLRLRQRKELSKGPYPCDICFSLTLEGGLSAVPTADVPLLAAEFPDEDVDRFVLCSSCSAVFTTVATHALARSDSDSHPANPTRHSNDDEDARISVHSFGQQICERWIHEGKADCSLQTDGTGKVSCPVQTEESVKVIAVQTEEWPWPEFHEPTCDEADYKVEYQQPEDWL